MSETHTTQYVVFNIGSETYALNSSFILRVEGGKYVRPIPNVSEEIKGITTIEEDVVPLVDLRVKFRIRSEVEKPIPFIIVTKLPDADLTVGFIVDGGLQVMDIPSDAAFSEISSALTGESAKYIQGIYRPKEEGKEDDLLIVLDIYKLLGLDAIEELKDMQDGEV